MKKRHLIPCLLLAVILLCMACEKQPVEEPVSGDPYAAQFVPAGTFAVNEDIQVTVTAVSAEKVEVTLYNTGDTVWTEQRPWSWLRLQDGEWYVYIGEGLQPVLAAYDALVLEPGASAQMWFKPRFAAPGTYRRQSDGVVIEYTLQP